MYHHVTPRSNIKSVACFAVVALATSLLAFAFVVRDIFHEGSLARARIARNPSLARGHVTGPVENVSAAETANRSTVLLERVDWRKRAEDLREQLEGAANRSTVLLERVDWRTRAEGLREQLEGAT